MVFVVQTPYAICNTAVETLYKIDPFGATKCSFLGLEQIRFN